MNSYIRAKPLRMCGAPVFLHWSALLVMGGCLTLAVSDPIVAIVATVSYFSVILIHELGHAFAARRLGYQVVSVRLSLIHGECLYKGSHESARDAALIAWAGPLAQFAAAALVWSISPIPAVAQSDVFGPLLVFLGYIGPLVALVNLAPGADLDGTRAWPLIPMLWRDFLGRNRKHRSRSRLKVVK